MAWSCVLDPFNRLWGHMVLHRSDGRNGTPNANNNVKGATIMGNSESSRNACPNSPLCMALCLRRPPDENPQDTWFDDLPRSRKKKKKKKKNEKLPAVPEEMESVCSTTSSKNGKGISMVDAKSSKSHLSSSSLDTFNSDRSLDSKLSDQRRSVSFGSVGDQIRQSVSGSSSKKKPKRKPKVKLIFVNGQFVDGSTEEGEELLKAAALPEEERMGGPLVGISTTVQTGHCGILGLPTATPSMKDQSTTVSGSAKLNPNTVKALGMTSSFKSDSSAASFTSLDSDISETSDSQKNANKNAVSSMIVLGSGYLLTASISDRVIKMWKVENDGNGNDTSVSFVRDFVGHLVGITCLEKVDEKGRFLSASKDCVIKLWDSRYNCDDTNDSASALNRILLATFDKVDRRSIHGIAITEGGSYVRPTDKVDLAMAAAMTKKAMKDGSGSVTKAAQQRQILGCSCEFATISGRHPVVKLWSMKHVEEEDQTQFDGNVAKVKPEQDLKHDSVVESLISVRGKGILLTGDRMGIVRLWKSAKNVFLPDSDRVWSIVRTFNWRPNSLSLVSESKEFAITSLAFLQGNGMFVSGSKSGNLRVWKLDGSKKNGETISKELICITGAHSLAVTAVKQGPRVEKESKEPSLSFSSASEDGKVLSFSIPMSMSNCNPCCFNVVNHGNATRYFEEEPTRIASLACLPMTNNAQDVLISGINNGVVNVLKSPAAPKEGEQTDALVRYRQAMEEESLTLHDIAAKICKGVESRNRKLQMKTYKNCFLGCDACSFLLDNKYAATRQDAVALGRVLASHLFLFDCVSKTGKLLEDDAKSYYRFSSDFLGDKKAQSKKARTAPDLSVKV